MVERIEQLDLLFLALADATRRGILSLVAEAEMSIGTIAQHFNLTFAAISKHIQVLERADLIRKQRRGKEQMVMIVPASLTIAREHIARYEQMWEERFTRLDALLQENTTHESLKKTTKATRKASDEKTRRHKRSRQ